MQNKHKHKSHIIYLFLPRAQTFDISQAQSKMKSFFVVAQSDWRNTWNINILQLFVLNIFEE